MGVGGGWLCFIERKKCFTGSKRRAAGDGEVSYVPSWVPVKRWVP